MVLEHPNDRNVRHIETQYFYGSDFLIAPILQPMEDADQQDVYLPRGTWFNFWTKERIVSRGEWVVNCTVGLNTVPIWVRNGATVAWAKDRLRTFNSVGPIEKVEVYGGLDGPIKIRNGEGDTIELTKTERGFWECASHSDVEVRCYN